MSEVALDPEKVRNLTSVLRAQATKADEAAGRIQTALVLADLVSTVGTRLVGRAEDWRGAATELDARATLAEDHVLSLDPPNGEIFAGLTSVRTLAEIDVDIDEWAGTDNDPMFDALVAERAALVDKWLEAETIPPSVLAELLPHLSIEEIVDIERRQPNSVSIAALNEVIRVADRQAFPDDPLRPEVEFARELRNALVADTADADSAVGLDVEVAAIAQMNGVSYADAERALAVGDIESLTVSVTALHHGPVRATLRAERNALVSDLIGGNDFVAGLVGDYLDLGFTLTEAYDAALVDARDRIDAAELAATVNDEAGFFEGIPGGIQFSDITDGLWDGFTDNLGDLWNTAKGAFGFVWNAVTNPSEIDDMVREKWDATWELLETIWAAIEAGDLELIVEEILLPIFGISMDDIRERGLDYGLAYALGANPDLLVSGGAAAIAKLADLRAAGRIVDTIDGDGIDLDLPRTRTDLDGDGVLDVTVDLDHPDLAGVGDLPTDLDGIDLDLDLDLEHADDLDLDLDFDGDGLFDSDHPFFDDRRDPDWEPPEGWTQRPSSAQGSWSGTEGNSVFTIDENAPIIETTAYRPGDEVPFINGTPDLEAYVVDGPGGFDGQFDLPAGTTIDNNTAGMRAIYDHIAADRGMTRSEVEQWFRDNDVTAHHFVDNTIQIVPRDRHNRFHHQGGAAQSRNGGGADGSTIEGP